MEMANLRMTLLPLFLAALLEAGGDAFVRLGLRSTATAPRILFFLAGAIVLFSYGWTVNTPALDFGRLIGVYIVFFFFVAQVISWIVFDQKPSHAVLIGGGFIAIGGLIISLASPN
jgi:drug/metabolite transporter superfamily protein YnfA